MLKNYNLRDTVLGDFRVAFLGFEGDKARIGISPKNKNDFADDFLNLQGAVSAWTTFYNTISGEGVAVNMGAQNKGDEISKFTPGHGADDYDGEIALFSGGELLIPLGQVLFFWVKIPSSYSTLNTSAQIGSPAFNGQTTDFVNFDKNMHIGWGESVPDNIDPIEENGQMVYYFYLPIFKLAVTRDTFTLERYDIGECVFLSAQFNQPGNHLIFSEASSYFD